MKKILMAAFVMTMIAGTMQAAVIPIDGDGASGWIRWTASGYSSGTNYLYLGSGSSGDNGGRNCIVFFELPTLGAGESISSADLSMYLYVNNQNNTDFDVDVYAIGTTNDNNVSNYADIATNGIENDPNYDKIMDAFLVNNTSAINTTYTFDSAAQGSLATWLNNVYTNGSPDQAYLVLRLNANLAADNDGASDVRFVDVEAPANAPVLTLTTVTPEPATMGLLGLGALAMLRKKRR